MFALAAFLFLLLSIRTQSQSTIRLVSRVKSESYFRGVGRYYVRATRQIFWNIIIRRAINKVDHYFDAEFLLRQLAEFKTTLNKYNQIYIQTYFFRFEAEFSICCFFPNSSRRFHKRFFHSVCTLGWYLMVGRYDIWRTEIKITAKERGKTKLKNKRSRAISRIPNKMNAVSTLISHKEKILWIVVLFHLNVVKAIFNGKSFSFLPCDGTPAIERIIKQHV